MLPEVEFWCSPPELGLEVGERPGDNDITTDHCFMDLGLGNNVTTQCSRYQGSSFQALFLFLKV